MTWCEISRIGKLKNIFGGMKFKKNGVRGGLAVSSHLCSPHQQVKKLTQFGVCDMVKIVEVGSTTEFIPYYGKDTQINILG